jgi:hypothetical protein
LSNPTLATMELMEKLLKTNPDGFYVSQFRSHGITHTSAVQLLEKFLREEKLRIETRKVGRRNVKIYIWNRSDRK